VSVTPPAPAVAVATAPPVADPGPLGLAAFAVTTFVLCVFNARLAPVALEPVVLPLALFYGGIVQVLAGMWEFRRANTFAAVAFSSYGAFWLSFAAYARFVAPTLPADDAHLATGLFLLAWTVFTAGMLLAALRTSVLLVVVFSLLLITFVLLTVGAFTSVAALSIAGGWAGLATAAGAWYGSVAGVTASTWGRSVLPVGPLTKA
jgi:succinate-acetate transporter protein